jgi:aryl-alcohol dehydrogenase-like predicted oxidoreductase
MAGTDHAVSRRDFVRGSSALLGGLAASGVASPRSGAGEDPPASAKVPQVELGRTEAKVSRLGIGCAYFQRKPVTPDGVRATLHRALELGINYLDTAPVYGNPETGFAEEKMGPAIAEIRDKVFLVTKTEEPTYDGTWKLLRQSLKRMRTDRVDLVHLHNFGDEKLWGDRKQVFGDDGAMAALREAKRLGVVRFIGASGHLHPTRFHEALDSGEIDVLMNAVNFVVRHTYDFEHKVWSRARHMNLGLVAMKVLGGAAREQGGFKMDEKHYEQAIRYALSIPGLSVAVIGLENIAELEKAASVVARAKPLTPEEDLALARVGLELAASPEWKAVYGTPLA